LATGIASAIADSILNAYCRNVSWTQPAAFYVKLHTGDPGSAGATNAAGNTSRQAATFSASSGGAITTSADIVWTSVSTTETYTHVSFWSASSAGTFLGSDNLEVSRSVTAGDTFTIATGDIDITLGAIAA
jgi:hypothetical protein